MPKELQVLEVNGSSEGGVKKCASSPCSVTLLSSAAQAAELVGCEKPFLNVTGGRVAAILSTQAFHVLCRESCPSNDGGSNCLALVEDNSAKENIIETSIIKGNTILISSSQPFHTNTYYASRLRANDNNLKVPVVKLMGSYGPGHGSGRKIVHK